MQEMKVKSIFMQYPQKKIAFKENKQDNRMPETFYDTCKDP